MKANLLLCFLCISFLAIGQKDRQIIKQIDDLNSSALSHFNSNRIAESFNEFTKSKVLSDSNQDIYGSAIANYHLGNIYNLMQNEKSAEDCYKSMLRASKKISDTYLTSKAYLSLGLLYKDKRIYNTSSYYLEKGIAYYTNSNIIQNNPKTQADTKALLFKTQVNLAEVYIERNLLEKALVTLLRSKKELEENYLDPYSKGYYHYVYGLYFTEKTHYNNAELKFREAILILETSNHDKSLMLLSNAYKELSKVYSDSGNNEEAYTSILSHNNYREKYLNEEKIKQDIIAKSKFLIADYKFNADLSDYKRLQQIEMTNKIKRINIIITVTLFLLFISLITLYAGYVSKRKLTLVLRVKNAELEIAKNRALKSSELKSKFISNVSHELRTPLYGVVGITSLLLNEKKNLNNRETKYLKSLKYSGDYLLNLVNDILQVNKMEAQKIELKNVSVNLKDMIQHIVDSFGYRLQESNNKIITCIDSSIPEYIKCDKVRLSQVLINLIGNSIKFTESGMISLRVKLLDTKNNEVGLRFEVEDNGKGIPEEKFKTIFENFSQLGNESNTNYQGTGLGLSITKNIIELFESKIEIESEVGVGTKFSFSVTFEVDNNKKAVLDINNKKENLSSSLNKYKILVAEDNKINQIVTKNLLVKQNYTCEIANNGLEAIQLMENNDYDLILMDINMPVMGGAEATSKIRKVNNIVPIIALTAADIEDVRREYKNIGFDDIITKPFDNYEFFQIIATQIQNSKSNDVKLVIAS